MSRQAQIKRLNEIEARLGVAPAAAEFTAAEQAEAIVELFRRAGESPGCTAAEMARAIEERELSARGWEPEYPPRDRDPDDVEGRIVGMAIVFSALFLRARDVARRSSGTYFAEPAESH